MTTATGVALIVFFVLLEAFFSGSEIAMVNANRIALQTRAEAGNAGAARAIDLLREEETLLGTCLIGTNLSTVSTSSVAALLLLQHGIQGLAVIGIVTPIVLIFAEALPKTIMQFHADRVAVAVSGPLRAAQLLFTPFLWVVRGWARLISQLTGAPPTSGMTRRELLELLEADETESLDPEERRLIRGVLSLTELTVAECMTPLIRVTAVNETATVGVAAEIASRTQHSRLPVYARRIDNITGLIHQADLLFLPEDAEVLAAHVRPVRFVPEMKRADEMFREMREGGEHFAVVVDEYGGCVGIVTLEDLLEELVGDIHDERDVVRPELEASADGTWRVPGNAEVATLNEMLPEPLPEPDDVDTVAGLVLAATGRIPAAGEQVSLGTWTATVEVADQRAVRRVVLQRLSAAQAAEALIASAQDAGT